MNACGHTIEYYACGKHIFKQCRCASPDKRKVTGKEECPQCERWRLHFAKHPFEPFVRRRALAMRVLCVARTRQPGHWAAYVNAVPGMRHEEEMEGVLSFGDKLPEEIARMMFPEFEDVPYAS